MQVNLFWTGQAYHSLENCLLTTTETGTDTGSVIIGEFEGKIYRIEYHIKTNHNWAPVFLEMECQLADKTDRLILQSDGKGNWSENGIAAEQYTGCMDIDISLTPFTNSLPINRLQLSENESHQIDVLYIDVLGGQIKAVQQKYTRLSKTDYKYENVPNDFEAVITVDGFGLVINYPGLFTRTAIEENKHR